MTASKPKTLVFDISNMLHRTFYANKNEDDITIAGLASHAALVTLNKYFVMHKPDKVVMAFDRPSWRKAYTASDKCVSKKAYKGNRRQDMTPKQEEKYRRFMEHIKAFEQMICECTTIVTLFAKHLEADDMIGGYVQRFASDEQIIIISSDTDYLQFLKYDSVSVMSPATDKLQELTEYDNDARLYLFAKCIRGDGTDNVQSAFPGVRMTRIKKAFSDPYELESMMNETWKMGDVEYRVGDLYAENQILIDLEKQPEDIRELLEWALSESLEKPRKFSLFKFMKFAGEYQLVKIRENVDRYMALMSQ